MTEVSVNMGFWELISQATLLVQMIMALLLAASVLSWVIILQRRVILGSAERDLGDFEQAFRQRDSLESLFVALSRNKSRSTTGMAWVFEAGMREFHRQAARGKSDPERLVEVGRREMRLAQMNELERLERGLPWLATIGSVSPYVGLFGTVWGIMNSFRALGNVESATISLVAPGIAEALIATAMGLFAAIPAVIAYNRFAHRVGNLEIRYQAYREECVTLLSEHAHSDFELAEQD